MTEVSKISRLVFVPCILAFFLQSALGDEELILIHHGDLPIVISAPHGGSLSIPGVPERRGDGKEKGAAGFRTVRDSGTEELALEVARLLDERLEGSPSYVVSRVHRKYVDFNRPPDIGVEHLKAKIVYDQYHAALADAVREIRGTHKFGLLIDLHGQGTSAETAYRGTSNGLTVTNLKLRFGDRSHTGPESFLGILRDQQWTVYPDPFDAKEQSGFTGGHIVRTYGSHRADGIDAIQLELGADYRKASECARVASELADSLIEFAERYLTLPVPAGSSR